jgi:hypothetical protein
MLFWDEHERFLYKKGLGVASLVRQPLIPRSQVDDTTISETMFQDVMLHNQVIPMRIDTDIPLL